MISVMMVNEEGIEDANDRQYTVRLLTFVVSVSHVWFCSGSPQA